MVLMAISMREEDLSISTFQWSFMYPRSSPTCASASRCSRYSSSWRRVLLPSFASRSLGFPFLRVSTVEGLRVSDWVLEEEDTLEASSSSPFQSPLVLFLLSRLVGLLLTSPKAD